MKLKKTTQAICLLIFPFIYSCNNCLRTNDETYFLSEQDKNLVLVPTQKIETYTKNNTSEINFTYKPTNIELNDIRFGDDEGCYSDWCQRATNQITIDNTDLTLYINLENSLNSGRFEALILNEQTEEFQYYKLIDSNFSEVNAILNYIPTKSNFTEYIQNFTYQNFIYDNVFVFKSLNTTTPKYIVIDPAFNILLLEYKEDTFRLVEM